MVSYKGVIFVTRLLKLRQHQMSDSFAALFEQSLNEIDMTLVLLLLEQSSISMQIGSPCMPVLNQRE